MGSPGGAGGVGLRGLVFVALGAVAAAEDRETIRYFVHKYNGLAAWLDWGGLPCRNSTRTCAGVAAPRVAFVVAGASRGFVERRELHESYKRFVVDSFAAAADSEVLLYLRGAGNATADEWAALEAALAPSVVARVADDDAAAAPEALLSPAARDCVASTSFARDNYLRRARAWWSSMAEAHRLVVDRERATGRPFDAVVFSRPDVRYDFPFGPHCEYDAETWYAGGKGAPDNFWILPRVRRRRRACSRARHPRPLVGRGRGRPQLPRRLRSLRGPCGALLRPDAQERLRRRELLLVDHLLLARRRAPYVPPLDAAQGQRDRRRHAQSRRGLPPGLRRAELRDDVPARPEAGLNHPPSPPRARATFRAQPSSSCRSRSPARTPPAAGPAPRAGIRPCHRSGRPGSQTLRPQRPRCAPPSSASASS